MVLGKKDIAMMVVSCDAYSLLGNIYFDLQERYMNWFEYDRFFVLEKRDFFRNGVKTIKCGDDCNWSGKVLRALEHIPHKYILFMLEDYFIGKDVDREKFLYALQVMKNNNLKYYKITNLPKLKKHSSIEPYLSDIPSNKRYGINLQAAIFEREFLIEILAGEDRSAWKTETDLLDKVTDKYEHNLTGCVVDRRNIIDVHNGVIKGKWVPETINYFQKHNYKIPLGNREVLSKTWMSKMKLKRMISHTLSAPMAKRLKKIASKLGIKFISEK